MTQFGMSCSFAERLLVMMVRGGSLIVGVSSADGDPRADRAWAIRVVDEERRRLRSVISADDEAVVAGLAVGRPLAMTGADVRTLDSVQMKGVVTSIGPVDETDVAVMTQQVERFFDAVHEVDRNPVDHLRRMLPLEVLAVEFEVIDAFDQSAGPGAGARVTGT